MNKFIKNFIYTAGYQVLLLIIPLITLPYVSRVLGPSQIGINAWSGSISYYFVLIATLGITTYGQKEIAIVRGKVAKLNETFWEIQFASVTMTILSIMAYLTLLIILNLKYKYYLTIYSIQIIACMFDVSWLFSGLEKFGLLALRNTIIKIVATIFIFIMVKDKYDLSTYIFLQTFAILFSNLSLWPIAKKFVFLPNNISIKNIIKRVKASFVYFIPQISISMYAVLNKIFLGFFSSNQQTGYFDSSDKILRLTFSFFIAASTVLLPKVSQLFDHRDFNKIILIIKQMICLSLIFVFPIIFFVISNSNLIINILLGEKYKSMSSVLILASTMLFPMSIANVLGNQLLVPSNRISLYTKSVVYGSIINIMIEIPLICLFKANGAAISEFLSESIVMLFQIYFTRDIIIFKEIISENKVVLELGLFLLFLGVLLEVLVNYLVIKLLISLILSTLFLVLFKKRIIISIKKIN